MAKTVATLTEELIIANIDGDRLKSAFRTACAVAKKERPAGDLAANAEAVHDLQEFADKLADLSKAISTSIKNAEGVFFDEHGDVTEGFKLKNTGSTTTVKDVAGLLAEAALLGYNDGAIRSRMTVSAKANFMNWAEAACLTKDRQKVMDAIGAMGYESFDQVPPEKDVLREVTKAISAVPDIPMDKAASPF